jgi:hypothetical protein
LFDATEISPVGYFLLVRITFLLLSSVRFGSVQPFSADRTEKDAVCQLRYFASELREGRLQAGRNPNGKFERGADPRRIPSRLTDHSPKTPGHQGSLVGEETQVESARRLVRPRTLLGRLVGPTSVRLLSNFNQHRG